MKINKISNNFIIMMILITSLSTSVCAHASTKHDNFYFNSGLSYHKFNVTKKIKGVKIVKGKLYNYDKAGIDFVFGKSFGSFGLELGYTVMGTDSYHKTVRYNNTITTQSFKNDNTNLYLDFNNYMSLIGQLNLKTAVGFGVLQTKTKGDIYDSTHKKIVRGLKNSLTELKPRFGLGLQYDFAKDWSSNLSFNYQGGNKYYKNMRMMTLGITYRL